MRKVDSLIQKLKSYRGVYRDCVVVSSVCKKEENWIEGEVRYVDDSIVLVESVCSTHNLDKYIEYAKQSKNLLEFRKFAEKHDFDIVLMQNCEETIEELFEGDVS